MPELRRSTLPLLACALVAAACTDDRSTAVAPTAFERAPATALATGCETTALTTAAQSYFPQDYDQDVYTDINTVRTACENGDAGGAKAAGFDVLQHVENVADANANIAGKPAYGAKLVVGTLGFMGIGTDDEGDFAKALGPGGMFEVQPAGLSNSSSRGGRPEWRIKTNWALQTLVYGHESDASPGAVVLAAVAKNKYDISSLPDVPPGQALNIAYCTEDVADNTRIQHNTASETGGYEFLSYFDPNTICTESLADASAARTMVASIARTLAGAFLPRDLHAATLLGGTRLPGGVGGFGSDLSPHFVTLIESVTAGYGNQPSGGFAAPGYIATRNGDPVAVRASTSGAGFPGAVVVLTVANNSGVPAGAYLIYTPTSPLPAGFTCPTGSACQVAGPTGVASFPNLQVDKPGGYYLKADIYFDGIPGATTNVLGTQLSNKFNIKAAK